MSKEQNARSLAELHAALVSMRTAQAGTVDAEERAILQTGSAHIEVNIQEKKVKIIEYKRHVTFAVIAVVSSGMMIASYALERFIPHVFYAQLVLQLLTAYASGRIGSHLWNELQAARKQLEDQKQKLLDE